MYNKDFLYRELSYKIIGCAMKVHRTLGCYLPEHVYQLSGIANCASQKSFVVYYESVYSGHFFTDIIVEDKIILELKSTEYITKEHLSQLFTYLHLAKKKVGYVINFGTRSMTYKRLIL